MGLFRSGQGGRKARMRFARGVGRRGCQTTLTLSADGADFRRLIFNLRSSAKSTEENMTSYHLDHLQYLETEAIHVLREVAAEFERPALLFSGGKDSICLVRLAEKAFRPSDIPMPLLNVDTGHHFPELNAFRDRRAQQLGAKLIVRKVEDAIAKGIAAPAPGEVSRNRLQIPTLLAAIEEFRFDCLVGGARRDEEKARAKERFFSFRDGFGQWDPKNQRPEIWNLYNARLNPGENMRVFPLSNWTEMDVWEYIKREKLEVFPNI